jgi:hypothetical protein
MANGNGKQSPGDLAHRIGIWVAVIAIAAKLFSVGAWVGAADEKFEDHDAVEEKQDEIILDLNTIQNTVAAQTRAIAENKEAIEESKEEVLAAIEALNE